MMTGVAGTWTMAHSQVSRVALAHNCCSRTRPDMQHVVSAQFDGCSSMRGSGAARQPVYTASTWLHKVEWMAPASSCNQ